MACTEPQYLYNGAFYLYLYLYSPYGPYGLYRASVPVKRCTLPLPIPLLPVWAARPVQSLSACTWCTLPLSIPLLPLWAVQPVQSLSACTTVHFTFLPLIRLLVLSYNRSVASSKASSPESVILCFLCKFQKCKDRMVYGPRSSCSSYYTAVTR